eukprot:scaffold80_cov382-Prasinococcus_capsulatus_cf.AAC.15
MTMISSSVCRGSGSGRVRAWAGMLQPARPPDPWGHVPAPCLPHERARAQLPRCATGAPAAAALCAQAPGQARARGGQPGTITLLEAWKSAA